GGGRRRPHRAVDEGAPRAPARRPEARGGEPQRDRGLGTNVGRPLACGGRGVRARVPRGAGQAVHLRRGDGAGEPKARRGARGGGPVGGRELCLRRRTTSIVSRARATGSAFVSSGARRPKRPSRWCGRRRPTPRSSITTAITKSCGAPSWSS